MTPPAWATFIALAMLFGACQRDVAPPESPPANAPHDPVVAATVNVTATTAPPPPPPPLELGLVDSKGYIRVPNWDDRHLTPAEKKANPIINPRWAPLARCLQTRGVSPGAPAEKFGQADLESLIGRLNAGGPLVANEGGRLTVRHSRETDAFVSCATTTLQVFSEDLYKILTPAELRAAQAAGDAPKDSPPALRNEASAPSCIDRILEGIELASRPGYDFNRDELPFRERAEREECEKDGRPLPGNRYPPPDATIQGTKPEGMR